MIESRKILREALRHDMGLDSGETDWELGYGRAFFFIIAENNSEFNFCGWYWLASKTTA